ncbi:TPA: hypothetical protein P7K80_001948 [Vibrio cholerae]|uniref:Uncharacterized protein n=2 Tax=Vibrio cholerae TaxID=666 RepID=A0ABD7SRQ6_VIBCL|nr:hypothetical protein [Vibrio cholerae]HAT7601929.1 hypothetical protein [Vibrio cholerae O1]EGQ9333611.1 hypothetical protein [Vibrio cholerae]EGR1049139.1 hypothetical protein [Vibrio cholerae]EGR3963680.1 hypothetical protein [Vibrio cholerae]EGR4347850.1 hypothetical protein [Vibrio cholerae]
MFKRLADILIAGFCMLLLGAAICFGMGWFLYFLMIDELIKSNIVADASAYWKMIQWMFVILILPPFYMGIYKLFPVSEQQRMVEGAKVLGLSVLYVGDWIGKGILLAVGAVIACKILLVG